MTNRPTPEPIIKLPDANGWEDVQVGDTPTHLAVPLNAGYAIVHPDDHPNLGIAIPHQGYMQWRAGYDDCWNDVFGGGHE